MNVTARNLIEQAYGIPWTSSRNERVVGGPSWIDNNRYDVDARIDESLVGSFEKLSHEERKEQMSLMMQSLLADRFKLKVHDGYGGRSLHEQSHGESFLSLLENRFRRAGFYVLDEPEAALSP